MERTPRNHARRFGPTVRNKYNVAPRGQRTYEGVVYASKAECRRAQALDLMCTAGVIDSWERQVKIELGPDTTFTVDFVVVERGVKRAEDVKGVETREFRRVRRLWRKYGTMPLHVLKWKGGRCGWSQEIIEPSKGDQG